MMIGRPEGDIDLLKDEYIALQSLVDSFDAKSLTIKAWSVTVSMSGIGAAFVSHSPVLLLLSSLSAIVFWIIESYWKSFQYPYYDRIEKIEAFFSGESSTITPFQISRTWETTYTYKTVLKVSLWSNVMMPHIIVFLAGVTLLILNRLSLMAL